MNKQFKSWCIVYDKFEVKGSGALPVEAREELEDIANACGILIARGKE